ncbi:hypothetical protein ACWCXE_14645 [Streptomyces sp. NPDC001780]
MKSTAELQLPVDPAVDALAVDGDDGAGFDLGQAVEAIGSARREAATARARAERDAREREYKEQLCRAAERRKAEREARRPVCAECGTKFTDERWQTVDAAGWGALHTMPTRTSATPVSSGTSPSNAGPGRP